GDERRRHLADRARQFGRLLPYRDGVQVDHAIDAVVAFLQLDEPGDGTEIVAEMQIAGRLYAREHALFECHRGTPCLARDPCHEAPEERKRMEILVSSEPGTLACACVARRCRALEQAAGPRAVPMSKDELIIQLVKV